METINHECYVSLELAKLLKEAGFDWKCINRYIKDTDVLVRCLGEANWNAAEWGINDYKSAPSLAVAQKWLREVKNVRVCVDGLFLSKTSNRYVVRWANFPCAVWKNTTEMFEYDTYEEALEAGIREVLELLEKEE